MQVIPKPKEKYEAVRIYNPKQKIICQTHEFRGYKFNFFNNNRGVIVGKGVRTAYDQKGNVVADFGWEDVVEHFKGMGFKVDELDLEGKVKKVIPKSSPQTTTTSTTTTTTSKTEDKK